MASKGIVHIGRNCPSFQISFFTAFPSLMRRTLGLLTPLHFMLAPDADCVELFSLFDGPASRCLLDPQRPQYAAFTFNRSDLPMRSARFSCDAR